MNWIEGFLRFIGKAWDVIWSFISGIPRFFFGSTLETGWGIVFVIYVTAVAIGFIIGVFAVSREFLKGVDVLFNEEWLKKRNAQHGPDDQHVIDWTLLRQQRVRSLRFIIPLGGLVLASLYIWVGHSFTGVTYATFAAIWFGVGLVLLRPWWVATAVWTARVTPDAPSDQEDLRKMTARGAFGHYMSWGLLGSASKKRGMFIRVLRLFNKIASLLRLQWFKVRLLEPLFWWLAVSIGWPVGMLIVALKMSYDLASKKKKLRPGWSSKPMGEPVYTGKKWSKFVDPEATKAQVADASA